MISFQVNKEEEGIRLDQLLKGRYPKYSRSYFQYLIDNKSVKLNDQDVKKREKPKLDDKIELTFLPLSEIELKPQNIPLEIIFEDEHIICVNKRAGMVVHPAPGHPDGTFVNALLYHCSTLEREEDDLRPGIVHRLDKETSGLIIAAKTRAAHQKLIEQFSNREIEKTYLAITLGNPGNVVIDAPIGRHPKRRKEMMALETGKTASTQIETIEHGPIFALVKAMPKTGRTHQIRVHLKSVNTPILGDSTYGNTKMNDKNNIPRQLLHAYQLSLSHPITGEPLQLTAPLPKDLSLWAQKISPAYSGSTD